MEPDKPHLDFIVTWLSWIHAQYPFVGQLLLLMMLDIVTGLVAAFITRTVNSSTGYAGMGRKVIILTAVAVGVILEPLANGIPLGKLVAVFYTFTEGISIVENVGRSGVPIPSVLTQALEKLRTPTVSIPDPQETSKQPDHTINSVPLHNDRPSSSEVTIKPIEEVGIATH